jgi:hypothetical protein
MVIEILLVEEGKLKLVDFFSLGDMLVWVVDPPLERLVFF